MIGGLETPFRLPCEADGANEPLLGLPNHQHAAAVDCYGNTTQMTDHCGNTVPVDKRYKQLDTCGNDICAPNCNDCPGGRNLDTNTPLPPSIAGNTWSAPTGKVQLEPTKKLGGKWPEAFKFWHGMFGFDYDADGLDCATGLVKSNIKYRTITKFASYTGIDGVTHTATRKYTVAENSGVITEVDCSDTVSGPSSDDTSDFFRTDLSGDPRCTSDISSVGGHLAECDPDTITSDDSGSYGKVTQTIGDAEVTTLEVTSHRSATSYTWVVDTRNYDTRTGPPATHYEGYITLSDAYAISDVLADAATLANEYRLTDDLKHPFRTDAHTTVAPIVVRNENPAPVSPNIYEDCGWVDPNAATYDGAIIGSPLNAGYGQPVGGNPQGVFDRDHVNWFRRNCEPGVGWTQGVESVGNFTPGYLPTNAPKWTDDFQATSLFPTAFASADVSGVYLQKWAEIQNPRPSINFARPYGPDKFAIDETPGYVFYVSNFNSSTGVVTLQNIDFTTPISLPFTGADIVGSAAVNGFYAVVSVSGNTVQLGTKVYDLPTDWDTPSGDGADCFGKLRFPVAPGMDFIDETIGVGGRVAITVTNGTPVTLTTATVQKYLSLGVNPEQVDILDASMTVLAADVDLTRVDDTHFTVTTAYATIATAKWIVPHVLNDGSTPGTKYKFTDSRPKGDYVYRTWLIKLEDSSVLATSQTDACLKFSPCGPSVAGITPNGESSPNGHFWAFPTSINNGELWLGQIQFWMPDPFWQLPHKPVGGFDPDFDPSIDIVIWNEDDGSCNPRMTTEVGGGGETIYHLFYPMRPYVEARCSLPTNVDGETAPALASGTADLTAVADPPPQAHVGNVEGPLVDAIVLPTPTWIKYLNQKGCVDGGGDFAADYEANGTPT